MYPHTPYLPSKFHPNQQTFSFDFVTKTKKHQKSPKHPFWPLYIFTFQKWKGQFWKKSFFGELGDLKIFRSEKVNHRNLREISARFHRDFIEISSRFHRDFACCKSKKKKKGKLFYLSKANFFEKLASTLTASISVPLQDRNFKFCRDIPYPTH